MSRLTREEYERIRAEGRARRERESAPGYVNKWTTHDPCEKCGRPFDEHSFVDSVACIYDGAPLKDGGTFNRETAKEIVRKVADRL